ncbi:MAG: adenylate/guanylate cyclase domain-containing protein [Rhodovibrionaceae bacterium]|nr:adenylate/guanylate cyclase domain-containing protein [Rhodovibrionaceae bacterium]
MVRRLAAILAADVVGYSRLMGKDETGTLSRLNAVRREILEPVIAEHRGRVVKLMGDGLLVEFSSVVDAVECALAWQQAVNDGGADASTDQRIRFRIGVNLGDVIVEDDDIFGDGVNVAARLEALAEPGGICVSEDAWRHARGRVAAVFRNLGPQKLKNISEPMGVFRVEATTEQPETVEQQRGSQSLFGQPTLALVPFRHLGDPGQSFIADGLTESLCAALAHFEEFAFVGAANDGEQASSTFVLQGSVQTSGSRARISVQLSETASSRKVWGQTFDRSNEDTFALQDEIIGIVASTMGEAVLEEGARSLLAKSRDEYTAYDWALDGVQHLHRVDPEENRVARASLEKAVSMAPDLPLAQIGLGFTYALELINGWPTDRPDAFDFAVKIARDLLRRNERFDHAHRLLARLYHFAGRHDEALEHSRRAYEINPYNSDMLMQYGLSLVFTGSPEEGLELMERGCTINPYAPVYYQVHWALGLFFSGRFEEAVARLRRLERPVGPSRLVLAASLANLDRIEEAKAEVDAHLAEHPDASTAVVEQAMPMKRREDLDSYIDGLKRAGLPEAAA